MTEQKCIESIEKKVYKICTIIYFYVHPETLGIIEW